MDLNAPFIQNLKKWRKIIGFSQKKLAEKCGAGHSYIRQIESGNRSPSFAFIGKIADALQIEPYQLFYDDTLKSSRPANANGYMELFRRHAWPSALFAFCRCTSDWDRKNYSED